MRGMPGGGAGSDWELEVMGRKVKTKKVRRPVLSLEGGQLKSLGAGRRVARGIGLIEASWGVGSVLVKLEGCFICVDVDWRKLDRTPNERLVRELIMQLEVEKYRKRKVAVWTPPFWFMEPE